ncbi:MAG: recombination protein RecR, partial [Proteobacteria bacterium]|nr:recombination protein RecR [Pseudomonadota bacterium]
MAISPLIDKLISAFQVLPGVGPKGAQRMALYLLQSNRPGGQNLVEVLGLALTSVRHCLACRTLSELEVCTLCADERRSDLQLCVVESPADVVAIEQA